MEPSCIDESRTSDSAATSAAGSPVPSAKSPPGSIVLDAESGGEAESRKLPSSKYKGVVPQPNGRWGAQIYEKHQRVWLGTFNEEHEAARAYDIAAQRFRGRDAVTNFKLPEAENEETEAESIFLNSHSKAEIVDMLRKHTYKDELEQSRRNRVLSGNGNKYVRGDAATMRARELLFEKAVTPSDVGKLNRLVIPKQHAEKHFPVQSGATSKGVLLNFEDANGRVWRFRYSYWNSSQSYVLTKGWSRFVKEKNLRAGDVVCFMRSTGPDRQLYIESKPKNGGPDQTGRPVQMVRIFGVNIFKVGGGGGNGGGAVGVDSNSVGGGCNTGKRMREVELLSMEYNKKQMVIGAL